jgi:hydroxymethylglutaryl-CoA reductase
MIKGFSKLNRSDKIELLKKMGFIDDGGIELLQQFSLSSPELREQFEGFSENVLSSYPLPYSIIPNMVVNGREFVVPMVTEESSVVAACASAAGYWASKGGFKCNVLGDEKSGQIFFSWPGKYRLLNNIIHENSARLLDSVKPLTANMEARGGGITGIQLIEHEGIDEMFELKIGFRTADSMGANFINSTLEVMRSELLALVPDADILMSILSNHTPNCVVECVAEAMEKELSDAIKGMDAHIFASRFERAVRIAQTDVYRAVTHNKGIYNGISAVALATANDFRAIEAAGHAYAAASGSYRSLSWVTRHDGRFTFGLRIPLAVGTVGGLTRQHPLAKTSFDILGNPNARTLMEILAATGLSSNFAALRALIGEGIQKGHMQMHLTNILNELLATPDEKAKAKEYFSGKTVSVQRVRDFLNIIREQSK